MDIWIDNLELVDRDSWTQDKRSLYDSMMEKYNFSKGKFGFALDILIDIQYDAWYNATEDHEIYSLSVTEYSVEDDTERVIKIEHTDYETVADMFEDRSDSKYGCTTEYLYNRVCEYINENPKMDR